MGSNVHKTTVVLSIFFAMLLFGLLPCLAVEEEFIQVKPTQTDKRSWGPEQATGAPDTHQSGDIQTAWASLQPDGGKEWLRVDFDKAVAVSEIRIRETFNPGAVCRVTAILHAASIEVEKNIWEGQDPTATAPDNFSIKPKEEVTTKSIKIYLDTTRRQGWNEIDAVELIGKDGSRQWASHATASSTYAERPQPTAQARRNARYPQPIPQANTNPLNASPLNADPFADFYQKRVMVLLEGGNSSKHPITVEGTLVRSAGGFLVIKDAIYSKMIVVNIQKIVYLKMAEPAKQQPDRVKK